MDPFRPANNGRYRLISSSDDASCRPTEDPPDLALDVAELGAAYLGGVAFTDLAAAGRVAEHQPGALARADAMFASRPAPFCSTTF